MQTKKLSITFLSLVMLGAIFAAPDAQLAFAGSGAISEHHFTWTDPVTQGQVDIWEAVFMGCSDGHAWEYEFRYRVDNLTYNPDNGNGFSGFQIIFEESIPDVHNQMSPAVGGPWMQNAFSGNSPPFGVEWDSPDGTGIVIGESGTFKFCTDERADIVVNDPPTNTLGMGPNGWGHSWTNVDIDDCLTFIDGQTCLFNGPISIPGQLLKKIGGETLPINSTVLFLAGIQSMTIWMVPAVVGLAGAAVFLVKFRANRD